MKQDESKTQIDHAFVSAVAEAELSQKAIDALRFAEWHANNAGNRRTGPPIASEALSAALYKKSAEAFRRIAMWGVLSQDDAVQAQAKRILIERYLDANSSLRIFSDTNTYINEDLLEGEIAAIASKVDPLRRMGDVLSRILADPALVEAIDKSDATIVPEAQEILSLVIRGLGSKSEGWNRTYFVQIKDEDEEEQEEY